MNTAVILASIINVCSGFSTPKLTCVDTTRLSHILNKDVRYPSPLASSVSSNEDLLPGIATIDAANEELSEKLSGLRDSPYFGLYAVDILASCEYMPQELFECYSETCEVYPVDDDEVPDSIRSRDYDEQQFELDGWGRWDMPSNDYYDLEQFPEGYTGYDGSMIWEYIHKRICFSGYMEGDEHWKADFNKAVSGIHSVVSAQVIRGIQEKIDNGEEFSDDEKWRNPAMEFSRRLGQGGETPKAVENLYFAYMLLLSAVAKAKGRLLAECESGAIDAETASTLKEVLSLPILNDDALLVPSQKLAERAIQSIDSLWEARMRSRELLRIMNCVQCNKCRLHGKVAMMGLSTALQLNIGRDGKGEDPSRITRVEYAALMTTLFKTTRAVDLCKGMNT